MNSRFSFPIRLKLLLALLLLVTLVVSMITFVMARLFHDDKRTYISDLTSVVSMGTAEECRSILASYRTQLQMYGQVMAQADLSQDMKANLLKDLLSDSQDLVAVSFHDGKEEVGFIYDARTLEAAGLTPDQVVAHGKEHPLATENLGPGEAIIENSMLGPDFPTFTMALSHAGPDSRTLNITAVVKLDKLIRLTSRSNVFEVYIIDGEGALLANRDPANLSARIVPNLPTEILKPDDKHSAGSVIEFDLAGKPMVAGLSSVGIGGVRVVAQIPRSAAYLATRDLLRNLLYVALLLLTLSALVGLLGARRMTRPIERLVGATLEIAKGRFDTELHVATNDEIGALANSFNQMASGLKDREEALHQAQTKLIQSEKLAAFGQLGAGIAHEVKNPLAGILGCAQISLRTVEKDSLLHRNLLLIEKETKRCKAIIENLLKFARQEKAELGPTDLNAAVRDAVAIVHHQLELQQVKLEENLAPDLPRVHGNANQLQQVLMNLLMNAQQAMEGRPGSVNVSTRGLPDGLVEIEVTDNGPGMSPEVQEKIFEPFFSTKPGGKGTGLGLSVSFGIVKDHGGEIYLKSTPGEGSSFIIRLQTHPARSVQTAQADSPA